MEDGGKKLREPSQTLKPSYSQTQQPESLRLSYSQTLSLINSSHQIQKSKTEFVYLED